MVRQLAGDVRVPGQQKEEVYLNAANTRHRWAKEYFHDVDMEFSFKVVWVAGLLRDKLGSPSSSAFDALPSRVTAHRAAGWILRDRIGYVYLQALAGLRRPRLRIVLGAYYPTAPLPVRAARALPKPPEVDVYPDPGLLVMGGLRRWLASRLES
jgi:hypothetical protein